jgi:hypothetical protein
MARIKSVLQRLEVRPAGRLSHCAHKKAHEIRKGEPRFVVKPPGPAAGEKGYCVACAIEMIQKAEGDLTRLKRQLMSN